MDRAGTALRWGVAVAVLVVAGVVVVVALDRTSAEFPDPIEVAVGADATVPDGPLRQVEADRVVTLGTGEGSPRGFTDGAEPDASSAPTGSSDTTTPAGSPGSGVTAPAEGVLGPLPTVEVPDLPGLTTSTTTGPLLDLLDQLPVVGSTTTTTTAPSIPSLPLPPLPTLLDPLLVP
jgi:hypothetical protein